MKTSIQFWLATLNQHGNPTLIDGPHRAREGAEHALILMRQLNMVDAISGSFAIAEVRLSKPTRNYRAFLRPQAD